MVWPRDAGGPGCVNSTEGGERQAIPETLKKETGGDLVPDNVQGRWWREKAGRPLRAEGRGGVFEEGAVSLRCLRDTRTGCWSGPSVSGCSLELWRQRLPSDAAVELLHLQRAVGPWRRLPGGV